MARAPFAVLIAVFVIAGWWTPTSTSFDNRFTGEGAPHLMVDDGISEQLPVIRLACDGHGYPDGSNQHLICLTDYQANELRVLNARFREITDALTRIYGVCIDRYSSKMVRCKEI